MAKSMVLCALVLVSCAAWASATDYPVGDSTGWALNFDYSTWASSKSFVVGDRLVFTYPATQHNVEEVSSSAYSSCSSSNPISTNTNGSITIPLSAAGKRYFICGIGNHCSSGMKLEVDVSASSATSSPPPPTTPGSATPPTTSTTTAPPPPPGTNGGNSAAGSFSAPLHAIAVLFGMMMLKMGGLF